MIDEGGLDGLRWNMHDPAKLTSLQGSRWQNHRLSGEASLAGYEPGMESTRITWSLSAVPYSSYAYYPSYCISPYLRYRTWPCGSEGPMNKGEHVCIPHQNLARTDRICLTDGPKLTSALWRGFSASSGGASRGYFSTEPL